MRKWQYFNEHHEKNYGNAQWKTVTWTSHVYSKMKQLTFLHCQLFQNGHPFCHFAEWFITHWKKKKKKTQHTATIWRLHFLMNETNKEPHSNSPRSVTSCNYLSYFSINNLILEHAHTLATVTVQGREATAASFSHQLASPAEEPLVAAAVRPIGRCPFTSASTAAQTRSA